MFCGQLLVAAVDSDTGRPLRRHRQKVGSLLFGPSPVFQPLFRLPSIDRPSNYSASIDRYSLGDDQHLTRHTVDYFRTRPVDAFSYLLCQCMD